jgi:hypothetical protein
MFSYCRNKMESTTKEFPTRAGEEYGPCHLHFKTLTFDNNNKNVLSADNCSHLHLSFFGFELIRIKGRKYSLFEY